MNRFFLKGNSSDESFIHDSSDSSDDEKLWAKEVRKNYRLIKKNEREKEQESSGEEDNNSIMQNKPGLDKVKNNVKFEEGKPSARRNR